MDHVCTYVSPRGQRCDRKCVRAAGCKLHWRLKPLAPCSVCGVLTRSTYRLCSRHSGPARKARHQSLVL